jgi:transcriptional regulator with GAF, ATPase, and Fis domain
MANTSLFIVTDDREQAERIKNFGTGMGCTVKVYTTAEWAQQSGEVSEDMIPSLSAGSQPVTEEGGKVLQFRQPAPVQADVDGKVKTINELESIAIENAISEFGGNLTEAAKALGIGRATLYRKVKQYGIDPSQARRRKAAAKAA